MWWRHEAVCGLPFYISKTAYVVCVSFCICPKPGVAIITMCGADHGNEKNRQNPILPQGIFRRRPYMAFFNSAVGVLQTLVVALGAGLGIWGAINLLEGYGNDNPGAKSQGMKQLMAGGGVALIGITLVPLLSGLFG